MKNKLLAGLAIAALLLPLGACSSGSESKPSESPSVAPPESPAMSPSPSPSKSP
ncbi:MAG: hypothetical protein WCD18_27130 [Thermosynechococcaceae cyanobacterium]